MRRFIDWVTRLAVRFRWLTILITALIIGGGIYSYTQLNQELLPDIAFPQTFIISQNSGASSENMLHMYSIPLEEEANNIDGIVNVETTSRDGLAFANVRNEFGLNQDRIVEDLETVVDQIEQENLAVRRLEPPDGHDADSMLGELSAETLLWLREFADLRGEGFNQQLSQEVWHSFSPETLCGLPEDTFQLLGANLERELVEKRSQVDIENCFEHKNWTFDPASPPELPQSWQTSDARFQNTADLLELATFRTVAGVLNNFHEDGYLVGPLGDTSDLTADDVRKVLTIEASCRQFYGGQPPTNLDGSDRCAFTTQLINSGAISALPENAFRALPSEIRSAYPRSSVDALEIPRTPVELPDAWQMEAMRLVTFSFSDIPLGNISISSAELEADELRQLVEDDLIPRLREEEHVADVSVVGGDSIVITTVDEAIEALEGSDSQQEGTVETTEDGVPVLPPSWNVAAGFLPEIERLETADDILVAAQSTAPATGEPYGSAANFINSFALDPSGQGQNLIRALPEEVWRYLAANEESFWANLAPATLQSMNIQAIAGIREESGREFPDRAELPEEPVTRVGRDTSLVLTVFKEQDANTVEAWDEVEAFLNGWKDDNNVQLFVAFEQASFIEESIQGVTNDGLLGAIMATIVILIFMNLSVRSTLVTAVSIPTSVMMAMLLIAVIPENVNDLLSPILDDVGRDTFVGSVLEVILRLFPATFTLNIMTLSGLTVAIGRVVDDSIVVLENIYRNVQQGAEQHEAVLQGTREVSVAILAATLTTMLVFLPLGLFGGVVGAFFLPFGLAVTYALVGSYLVAITTVPALSSMLITKESMPVEGEDSLIVIESDMNGFEKVINRTKNALIGVIGGLSNGYGRFISFVLGTTLNRLVVIGVAISTLIFGLFLLGQRPQTFLPDFGEPTITVNIDLPSQINGQLVTINQTDNIVADLESFLLNSDGDGVETVVTSVGGDAQQFDSTTDEVSSTEAVVRVGMASQEDLENFLPELREYAENLLNERFPVVQGSNTNGASYIQVSGASATDEGFGGFSLQLTGQGDNVSLADLRQYNDLILNELSAVDGLVNVESSATGLGSGESTYIRIDGTPAILFNGEFEGDDTLGITTDAIQHVDDAVGEYREENPELNLVEVDVSQGFESEQQNEGFAQIFISMGIATLLVYLILTLTFGNFIHPLTILVSLPLSVVGAAVALAVTDRVLGLSSLIGLLMLIGIVVTNAVVFLDRVQQNKRERNMSTYDALVEAGQVRLRPILMTAISTTCGVFPLALGLTEGAIIAAELGTVVIGGLISSTFLTLIVLPVVYSLFDDLVGGLGSLVGLGNDKEQDQQPAASSATSGASD